MPLLHVKKQNNNSLDLPNIQSVFKLPQLSHESLLQSPDSIPSKGCAVQLLEQFLKYLVICSFYSLISPRFQFIYLKTLQVNFSYSGFLKTASLGFGLTWFPDLVFFFGNGLLTHEQILQCESKPYTIYLNILEL